MDIKPFFITMDGHRLFKRVVECVNTSSASIPIALDEANREGQFLQPFPPVYLNIDVYDT